MIRMDMLPENVQQMTFEQRVSWLLFQTQYYLAQGMLGLGMFAWASGLTLNPTAFSLSRTYDVMASIAPQLVWALIADLLFLAFTLSAVFRWHRTHAFAVFGVFLWCLFAGVMFALSAGYSPGVGFHLFMFVPAAILVFLRYCAEHDGIFPAWLIRCASDPRGCASRMWCRTRGRVRRAWRWLRRKDTHA